MPRTLRTAAALLLAATLAACSGGQATSSAKKEAPPPEVGFVTVTTRSQEMRTELPGRTRASQSAEVRPQVGGVIQKRLFTEGSWVKAGQPLYVIDAPNFQATVRQSNSEAQLIDWIHEAIDAGSGIIINPAAFSFTSMAIMDALKMFPGPIVEVHITNIHRREEMYHHSYMSKVATAVIAGLGAAGYRAAISAILEMARGEAS